MSQLPPCSRGGTVRAPSARDLGLGVALGAAGMRGRRRTADWRGRGTRVGLVAISAVSRSFQVASSLRIGQTADQAGMDQAGEVHAGNVARRGVEALDVPDRLLRQREMIGQEAAAVLLGEEAVEAPQALLQRADVEQVDHQEIAGLGALDADRAGQEVHDRQIDVAHVVGGIVVLDEAAGPVVGLDDEIVARA